MSNPAVCFLSTSELDGISFRIEDNLGESIHIHYGLIRIALSIDEFFLFADSIKNAAKQLFELNGFIWEDFDAESFKYEWIKYYTGIKSINCVTVRLDSLFMKESYTKKRDIKRIIPLCESGYVRLLEGDRSDIDYYSQIGKYEPSRKEKIEAIGKIIDGVGYPFDHKKILINQDGYILDGIKRASYLYYKFGGKKEIIVNKMDLPEMVSIQTRREEAEQEITKWMSEQEKQKRDKSSNRLGHSAIQITVEEIIKKIKDSGADFFVVKKEKMIEGKNLVNGMIIVQEPKFDDVKKMFYDFQPNIHPYEGYRYLYALKKPFAVETVRGTILIFDRPACKSRFEKELLPMDQYVNELCWKHLIWNEEWKCSQLDLKMLTFWAVLDALLEARQFRASDIKLIEENQDIFEKEEYTRAFEKEFFRYAPSLINFLLSGRYDEALAMYEQFSDY